MLNEDFLRRLAQEFPKFYDRVDAEARDEALALQKETDGDVRSALLRARFRGAARIWWPYVKGSVPMADDREAMEGFTRVVLTVDHLLGNAKPSMEEARDHVVGVLRESLDVERLVTIADGKRKTEGEEKAAAAAGAGLLASAGALMVPIRGYRTARKYLRFVPKPARVAIGAAIVAAVASVPLVAGYSAGLKAERAAEREGAPRREPIDTTGDVH